MGISESQRGIARVLKSRTAVAVTTAIITASVVGGVAWAAQSPVDNAGVIHGCYNPSTGVVKLRVNPTCPVKGATTPISWNAQGVQGIPGPEGPPGPPGIAGAPGDAGVHVVQIGYSAPVMSSSFTVVSRFPLGTQACNNDVAGQGVGVEILRDALECRTVVASGVRFTVEARSNSHTFGGWTVRDGDNSDIGCDTTEVTAGFPITFRCTVTIDDRTTIIASFL